MKAITLEELRNWKPEKLSPQIRPIREILSDLIATMQRDVRDIRGYPSLAWPNFDACFGGARSELVTVTADTGEGKSTFARNWLVNMVEQKLPCLLITLEDSIQTVAGVMSTMVTGRPLHALGSDGLALVGTKFDEWPLWYIDHSGPLDEGWIMRCVAYAAQEMKVKFVVIDHLDYILKNGWGTKPEAYVIGDTMRRLAGLSHSMGVCIVLIAHPSKRGAREGREVVMDELKGSSSIKQESDSVFVIHRSDPEKAEAYVRFLKIRNSEFSKNLMGKISFQFDPTTLTWHEFGGLKYD